MRGKARVEGNNEVIAQKGERGLMCICIFYVFFFLTANRIAWGRSGKRTGPVVPNTSRYPDRAKTRNSTMDVQNGLPNASVQRNNTRIVNLYYGRRVRTS